MPKRSRKPAPATPARTKRIPSESPKNPAAIALGRLGGAKGGLARAKALSAKRRKEIAQRAAEARWRGK